MTTDHRCVMCGHGFRRHGDGACGVRMPDGKPCGCAFFFLDGEQGA